MAIEMRELRDSINSAHCTVDSALALLDDLMDSVSAEQTRRIYAIQKLLEPTNADLERVEGELEHMISEVKS